MKCIWKDVVTLSTKHPKGKGGFSILVGPSWKKKITNWGSSPCNRASWVTFKDEDFEFGIFLVYAPNEFLERIVLWKWLVELPNIPWILVGDFNMVERAQDKMGGLKFEWKGNEHI